MTRFKSRIKYLFYISIISLFISCEGKNSPTNKGTGAKVIFIYKENCLSTHNNVKITVDGQDFSGRDKPDCKHPPVLIGSYSYSKDSLFFHVTRDDGMDTSFFYHPGITDSVIVVLLTNKVVMDTEKNYYSWGED